MKEKILKQGNANWYHGVGSKGGKLVLTDNSIYFEAHSFNVGKREFEVSLDEVTGVSKGFLTGLTISTVGGVEKFAVNGGKSWVEEIQKAMNNRG